jgi:hypothetical protein
MKKEKIGELPLKVALEKAPRVWKKVLEKQIAENDPEWQKLIMIFGSPEKAREYLTQAFDRVFICTDGDLDSLYERADVANDPKIGQINKVLAQSLGEAMVLRVGHDTTTCKFLVLLRPGSPGSVEDLVHEFIHATATLMGVDARKDIIDEKKKDRAAHKKMQLDMKLQKAFLGSTFGIILLELADRSRFSPELFVALVITCAGGNFFALQRGQQQFKEYRGAKHEVKAIQLTEEILNESL